MCSRLSSLDHFSFLDASHAWTLQFEERQLRLMVPNCTYSRRDGTYLVLLLLLPWSISPHRKEHDLIKRYFFVFSSRNSPARLIDTMYLHRLVDYSVHIVLTLALDQSQLDGTIIAPTNPKAWGSGLLQWLEFTKLRGITIRGHGIIDGQGSVWWTYYQWDDQPVSLHKGSLVNVKSQSWMLALHACLQISAELSGKWPSIKPTVSNFRKLSALRSVERHDKHLKCTSMFSCARLWGSMEVTTWRSQA